MLIHAATRGRESIGLMRHLSALPALGRMKTRATGMEPSKASVPRAYCRSQVTFPKASTHFHLVDILSFIS
jgi:hypothetical protein